MNLIVKCLVLALLSLSVASCGVRGDPEPPSQFTTQ
jgi:predicted small lipoprotein YifL